MPARGRPLSTLYAGMNAEQLRDARAIVLEELAAAALAGVEPHVLRQHAVLAERIGERANRLERDRFENRRRVASQQRRTATA